MHALGEVQQGQRLRVLQASHRLHPGARGVDHAARAHAHAAPAQAAGGLDTGGAAALANDRVHRGVVQHRRAEASRGAEVGQHEVGVVGEVLAIDAGVGVDGAIQRRLLARDLLGVPVAVDVLALDGAELLVGARSPRASSACPPGSAWVSPPSVARPGAARCGRSPCARGRSCARVRCRPARGSESRRGSASRSDSRCRRRSPPPRAAPPRARAARRAARPRRRRSRPRSRRNRSARARADRARPPAPW